MTTHLFPATSSILKHILSESPIYNESMTAEELISIAKEYMNYDDFDNMKKCYTMAINKNNTQAMIHLGKFYECIEFNIHEMIRLYTLAYENGNKNGALLLVDYYKLKNDIPNTIKYLNIRIDRFDDIKSMEEIIIYYTCMDQDKQNAEHKNKVLKYCDTLITYSPLHGQFIKGKIFQLYNDYESMKIHYNQFLNDIDKSTISFNKTDGNPINKNFISVIKFYLDNEINLKLVQNILSQCDNIPKYITGHMQYKINKTNYKDPPYNKIDICSICWETKTLQLFDCGGHWHCHECTIKIKQCSTCSCLKTCSHI